MPVVRIFQTLLLALVSGGYIFGQVKFDTFPKIPKMPDLTQSEEEAVCELHLFLWNHWVNHQRGIAQIKSVSKEGSPSLVTYIIAPDQRQRWAITEIIQASGVSGSDMLDFPPTVRVAHKLEVVVKKDDGSTQAISDPKGPFSRSFLLRMRGADGWESVF